MTKLSITVLATLALSSVAAAPALATPTITSDSGGAHYTGDTTDDTATVSLISGPTFKLVGTATPGTNCSTSGADVLCSFLGGWDIDLSGQSGDDTLSASSGNGYTTANGDAGDDHLFSSAGQRAFANGGDDNDVITSWSNSGGTTHGDAGNDIMIVRENGATAGDAGGDFLVLAGQTPNFGDGGTGADRIIANRPGGTLSGGDGNDILAFGSGSSSAVFSGASLDGGIGSDRLYGSSQPDTITGGAGNDTINSYGDSQTDTVDCGADTDTAYVDSIDTVTNCETVVVGSAAPSDPAVSAAISDAATYLGTSWDTITPLP